MLHDTLCYNSVTTTGGSASFKRNGFIFYNKNIICKDVKVVCVTIVVKRNTFYFTALVKAIIKWWDLQSEGTSMPTIDVTNMHTHSIYNSMSYFVCIGFNIPFNTFQVIPGWYLLVTEGMITTLECCLTEISYHRHSLWYPAQSHYSGNWSTSLCVDLPFICWTVYPNRVTSYLQMIYYWGVGIGLC